MEIFDKNIQLMEKALQFRAKRNELIASNIANRETPGFKAQDILFEKQLQKAYYNNQDPLPLKTTNPLHYTGQGSTNLQDIQGDTITSFNPETKYDENSVDLDQQMAKLSANQLLFESTTKMIARKLQILKDTIIEGGR